MRSGELHDSGALGDQEKKEGDVDAGENCPLPKDAKAAGAPGGRVHAPGVNVSLVKKCCRVFLACYYFALSILFVAIPALLVKEFGFSRGAGFQAICFGAERGINFFTAPMLGVLSDHIGRKPVIIASVLVTCVPLGALSLWPGPLTFLLYYTLSGFNSVLFMVYTIMTDVVDPHASRLAGAYGKLNVAICAGMVTGPVVSGFLTKITLTLPLQISAGLMVVCIFIISILPETRGQLVTGQSFDWESANPIKRIVRSCGTRRFRYLAIPYFFLTTAESVYVVFVLYLMRRYHWSRITVGIAISTLAICQATVQGSIKYLVPRLLSEQQCVAIGLSSHIIATLIMGFSPMGWMLAFAIIFMMGGGLKSPAMLCTLTSSAPEKSKGTLQGSLQSLRALSLFCSGPLYAGLLSYSVGSRTEHGPSGGDWVMGLPFYTAASCDFIALVTAGIAYRRLNQLEAADAHAERKVAASAGGMPAAACDAEEAGVLLIGRQID